MLVGLFTFLREAMTAVGPTSIVVTRAGDAKADTLSTVSLSTSWRYQEKFSVHKWIFLEMFHRVPSPGYPQ